MSTVGPRDGTAFEIRDALREPGCAICQLALRSVVRLIKSIAYEQINDVDFRDRLRRARGFCNPHAHLWLREARSVLGTALIYRDLLATVLREIDSLSDPPRLLRGLRGRAADLGVCPACQAQLAAETRYLEALLDTLADDSEVLAALDASDGLCRRHTLAALRTGSGAAAHVARRTRRTIETLLEDLDEVIRKEDYRFRDEPRTDRERTAPARAVAFSSGIETIVDGALTPRPTKA